MTDKQVNTLLNALKMGGVFVTCGTMEKANVMSTRWGSVGRMWNRDVFFLPVRKKKYSNELITKNQSFVVNVPLVDMTQTLIKCEYLSGQGINKADELGLTLIPSKKTLCPSIEECDLHIECKVICTLDMTKDKLDANISKDMYIGHELHTIFIGEIIRTSQLKLIKKI